MLLALKKRVKLAAAALGAGSRAGADTDEFAARWGFSRHGQSTVMTPREDYSAGKERADMRTRTPAHSHHSELHRLFLGGLLPSRARVRFAGSLTVRHHMTLMQLH